MLDDLHQIEWTFKASYKMNMKQQIEQLITDAFENFHGNSNLIALEPLLLTVNVTLNKLISRQKLVEVVDSCDDFEFVNIEMPLTGELGAFIRDKRLPANPHRPEPKTELNSRIARQK